MLKKYLNQYTAASHPGQLSLAIPPWVSAMSISERWTCGEKARRIMDAIAPYPSSVV